MGYSVLSCSVNLQLASVTPSLSAQLFRPEFHLPITPFKSHSCVFTTHNSPQITFLRKNHGGGPSLPEFPFRNHASAHLAPSALCVLRNCGIKGAAETPYRQSLHAISWSMWRPDAIISFCRQLNGRG